MPKWCYEPGRVWSIFDPLSWSRIERAELFYFGYDPCYSSNLLLSEIDEFLCHPQLQRGLEWAKKNNAIIEPYNGYDYYALRFTDRKIAMTFKLIFIGV